VRKLKRTEDEIKFSRKDHPNNATQQSNLPSSFQRPSYVHVYPHPQDMALKNRSPKEINNFENDLSESSISADEDAKDPRFLMNANAKVYNPVVMVDSNYGLVSAESMVSKKSKQPQPTSFIKESRKLVPKTGDEINKINLQDETKKWLYQQDYFISIPEATTSSSPVGSTKNKISDENVAIQNISNQNQEIIAKKNTGNSSGYSSEHSNSSISYATNSTPSSLSSELHMIDNNLKSIIVNINPLDASKSFITQSNSQVGKNESTDSSSSMNTKNRLRKMFYDLQQFKYDMKMSESEVATIGSKGHRHSRSI
jgi:hypothetical protein